MKDNLITAGSRLPHTSAYLSVIHCPALASYICSDLTLTVHQAHTLDLTQKKEKKKTLLFLWTLDITAILCSSRQQQNYVDVPQFSATKYCHILVLSVTIAVSKNKQKTQKTFILGQPTMAHVHQTVNNNTVCNPFQYTETPTLTSVQAVCFRSTVILCSLSALLFYT